MLRLSKGRNCGYLRALRLLSRMVRQANPPTEVATNSGSDAKDASRRSIPFLVVFLLSTLAAAPFLFSNPVTTPAPITFFFCFVPCRKPPFSDSLSNSSRQDLSKFSFCFSLSPSFADFLSHTLVFSYLRPTLPASSFLSTIITTNPPCSRSSLLSGFFSFCRSSPSLLSCSRFFPFRL